MKYYASLVMLFQQENRAMEENSLYPEFHAKVKEFHFIEEAIGPH
jgi:hypothetical protein